MKNELSYNDEFEEIRIPREIYLNEKLTTNDKFLIVELRRLADFLGVDIPEIYAGIARLKDANYLYEKKKVEKKVKPKVKSTEKKSESKADEPEKKTVEREPEKKPVEEKVNPDIPPVNDNSNSANVNNSNQYQNYRPAPKPVSNQQEGYGRTSRVGL